MITFLSVAELSVPTHDAESTVAPSTPKNGSFSAAALSPTKATAPPPPITPRRGTPPPCPGSPHGGSGPVLVPAAPAPAGPEAGQKSCVCSPHPADRVMPKDLQQG